MNKTIEVRLAKSHRAGWPVYKVTERTERGGFRNAQTFDRLGEARMYAHRTAAMVRATVVEV